MSYHTYNTVKILSLDHLEEVIKEADLEVDQNVYKQLQHEIEVNGFTYLTY